LGAGLWLYSHEYFVGLAVQNIIPGKMNFAKNNEYASFYDPNYFLTAGYRFLVSEELNLTPSAMLQYWEPRLLGIHLNAKLQYLDRFWVGGSYRFGDLIAGYAGMAGLNISNTFNISYAYETATTSRLRAYTGSTHEIMVGFMLGNKYGSTCPRNVW
jgi:type IX secretion system PorP/SprF family membrane protein